LVYENLPFDRKTSVKPSFSAGCGPDFSYLGIGNRSADLIRLMLDDHFMIGSVLVPRCYDPNENISHVVAVRFSLRRLTPILASEHPSQLLCRSEEKDD
jgi:hypothetical protein